LRVSRDMSTLPEVSVPFTEMEQLLPSTGWNFTCDLQVEYASEENASMVYTALSVDKELQPDKVKRNMVLNGRQLLIQFVAVEARFLRASFSAFVDILVLATSTIEQFGSN